MRLAFANATVIRAFNRGGLLLLGAAAVHREVSEQRGIGSTKLHHYRLRGFGVVVVAQYKRGAHRP